MGVRLWAMTLLLAAACQEFTLQDELPELEVPADSDTPAPPVVNAAMQVEPDFIDFGYIPEGDKDKRRVHVTNLGDVPVTTEIAGYFGSPAFTWRTRDDEPLMTLQPGESGIVEVTFTSTANAEEGSLRLKDADDVLGSYPVTVVGTGENPLLVGTPNPLEFGDVPFGQTATRTLTLSNPGNQPVHVSDVVSDAPEFTFTVPRRGLDIPAGGSTTLEITYTSDPAGGTLGELTLTSDARLPAAPVTMEAGVTSPDKPSAVCQADPPRVTALRQSARFDGTGSSDPNGRPLTYRWTLTGQPTGSTITLPRPNARVTGSFTPDVVGTYEAELIVTNDLGVSSDPCVAELEAEPHGGLWVEMFWQHGGDDMDLHLLRDGGNRTSGQDCYYGNCRGRYLSWGANGRNDDPILDIDDIPGTGPENINIDGPERLVYTVDVHDYPGSARQAGNRVTVRIYAHGALLFEETRNVQGEDIWERFATVDWTDPNNVVVTPR